MKRLSLVSLFRPVVDGITLGQDHQFYFEMLVLKKENDEQAEKKEEFLIYLCAGPKTSKLNPYYVINGKIEREVLPVTTGDLIAPIKGLSEYPTPLSVYIEFAGNHGYRSTYCNDYAEVQARDSKFLEGLKKLLQEEGFEIDVIETAVV